MKLWRRRRKAGETKLVVYVDGTLRPAWALRAGQRLIATDYDHGGRQITVWVESQS